MPESAERALACCLEMDMTFRVTHRRTGTVETVQFDSVDDLLAFMLRVKAVLTRSGHLEIDDSD